MAESVSLGRTESLQMSFNAHIDRGGNPESFRISHGLDKETIQALVANRDTRKCCRQSQTVRIGMFPPGGPREFRRPAFFSRR